MLLLRPSTPACPKNFRSRLNFERLEDRTNPSVPVHASTTDALETYQLAVINDMRANPSGFADKFASASGRLRGGLGLLGQRRRVERHPKLDRLLRDRQGQGPGARLDLRQYARAVALAKPARAAGARPAVVQGRLQPRPLDDQVRLRPQRRRAVPERLEPVGRGRPGEGVGRVQLPQARLGGVRARLRRPRQVGLLPESGQCDSLRLGRGHRAGGLQGRQDRSEVQGRRQPGRLLPPESP